MTRFRLLAVLGVGMAVGLLCGAMLTIVYCDQPRFNYDQVVAKIGDTTITRGQLAERAINHLGLQLFDAELVNDALVQEVARRNGVTVTPAEVDDSLDDFMFLIKQYREFAQKLGVNGPIDAVARQQLRDRFRTQLLAEKLMGVTVSNEDITAMSLKCAGSLRQPEMVKLVLIACDDPMKAKAALNRLNQKDDPRKLSELYSVKEVGAKHGELGWFTEEKMSQNVADAIFGSEHSKPLQRGEHTKIIDFTDPTTKQDQWLIFYVDDYHPLYMPGPDEVKPIAKYLARSENLAKVWPDWIKKQTEDKTLVWSHIKDLSNPDAPLVDYPIPISTPKPHDEP